MTEKTITTYTSKEVEIFEYLNRLRDSGITNMFGATPYIIEEFNINKRDASKALTTWMGIFEEEGYDHLLIKD